MSLPKNHIGWLSSPDCVSNCRKSKVVSVSLSAHGWPPFTAVANSFASKTRYMTMTVSWEYFGYLAPGNGGPAVFTLDPKNGSLLSQSGTGSGWPFKATDWADESFAPVVESPTQLSYYYPGDGGGDGSANGSYVRYTLSDAFTLEDADALVDEMFEANDINNDLVIPFGQSSVYYTNEELFEPGLDNATSALPRSGVFDISTGHITPVLNLDLPLTPSLGGGASAYNLTPNTVAYGKLWSLFAYRGPYCISTAIGRVGETSPVVTQMNGPEPEHPCSELILVEPPVLNHTATPRPVSGITTINFNSQKVGSVATGYFRAKNAGASNANWTFADGETVTIGSRVYTFKTSITAGTAGWVVRGSSYVTALRNLIAAINGAAGAGTTYTVLTTPHADVSVREADVTGASSTLGNKAMIISAKASDVICSSCATDGNAIAIGTTATFLFPGAPAAQPYPGTTPASSLAGGINAADGVCTDL